MEIAVLALGCFWGPEIKFSKINGIIKTEVGYCGGNSPTTTYKEVCTGETNHAEGVKLEYDEKEIPGLREHSVYGQMNDFKGSYISVESIVMGLNNIENDIYNSFITEVKKK